MKLMLSIVLCFTSCTNDSLTSNHHALICHVIDRCQSFVNATMCGITPKTIIKKKWVSTGWSSTVTILLTRSLWCFIHRQNLLGSHSGLLRAQTVECPRQGRIFGHDPSQWLWLCRGDFTPRMRPFTFLLLFR